MVNNNLQEAKAARLAAEARKFAAEAERAEADAELKRLQKAREEQSLIEAESVARASLVAAEMAEIDRDRVRYARDKELSQNEYHRVYHFSEQVGPGSVAPCMAALSMWHRVDVRQEIDPQPITIVFTSPGGDIIHGMVLYDFIQNLRRKGHHITTEAMGYAASMAGILLQSGDERIMNPESWLLIHQTQFSSSGSWGDHKDRMKWIEKVQGRILDIFAARTKEAGEKGTAQHPLSREDIEKGWERTDWWLSSEEALDFGLVDSIKGTL
jgi:ATP-dependent protease ClpP protease subunit